MPTSCEELKKIGHNNLNGTNCIIEKKKVRINRLEVIFKIITTHHVCYAHQIIFKKTEAIGSLEAKVAQLESKLNLLEAKVEQQSLVNEQENQTYSEDDGEKGGNDDIQDETSQQHRSCFELKTANPWLTSGMHWIDPDGENSGDPPIHVHCDMENGRNY